MNQPPDFSKSNLRADIQGLRAIAVALVLLFHFGGITEGGYLGVDMFFVISGFVITQSTIREIRETSTFSWRNFLKRRVRRLLPGAAVVLAFTAVAALIFLSPFGPQQETARMIVGAATYSTNFLLMPRGYFAIESGSNPLLHFWSLAVEEQFYAVWPFAVIAFVVLRRRMKRTVFHLSLALTLISAAASSCLLYYLLIQKSSSIDHYSIFNSLKQRSVTLENFGFYSPFSRAWEFLAGVLGSFIVAKRKQTPTDFWSGFTWVVGATSVAFSVLVVGALGVGESSIDSASHALPTLLCVLGTVSLLVSGANLRISQKVLGVQVLRSIGDWSYSIYLWHWPLWAFATRMWSPSWVMAICIATISIGAGAIQYQLFENPVRQKKVWRTVPSMGLVASLVTGSIVVAACYSWLVPNIAVQIAGRITGESALHIIQRPCEGESITIGNARSCIYSNPEGERTAVLVGDSMAMSLSGGFTSAAANLGMKSAVFSMPGCAYLDENSPIISNQTCSTWRANVFDAIRFLHPDVVVIANLSSLYIDILNQTNDPQDSSEIWANEISTTLDKTLGETRGVLVAQPPPKFLKDVKYGISLIRPIGSPEKRKDVDARRLLENSLETKVVLTKNSQIKIFNFDNIFCGERTCSQVVENQLMFEDSDHLTPQGSLLLVSQLEEAMKQLISP
jgi:peptidoglycan/LPS O-acetylase OafA/YrhL